MVNEQIATTGLYREIYNIMSINTYCIMVDTVTI